MKSLSFQPADGQVLRGEAKGALRRYRPPVREFELDLVELRPGESWQAQGPDILLVLEGELSLSSVDEAQEGLLLKKGEQVFCSAQSAYQMQGRGRVARASVGTRVTNSSKISIRPMP